MQEGQIIIVDDPDTEYEIVYDLPSISFSWSPEYPMPGEDVKFVASAMNNQGNEIVTWEWDFGDGNTASGKTVHHSYAVADSYTVILTATYDVGHVSTAESIIEVVDSGLLRLQASLEGTRPDPAQWEIPIHVCLFAPNSDPTVDLPLAEANVTAFYIAGPPDVAECRLSGVTSGTYDILMSSGR